MADDGNTIGEYQLINCIAMGKFSAVWEVMEEGTPNRFAIKLLLPEALSTSAQVRSLKFEAKVAQALDHPSLIRMHAIVTRRDAAYIVMDLFKSQNLKNFIVNDLGGVQLRIGKLMESVCMALGHMHDRGWIHKDVKPDNILMNKGSEVRLIDFSLSIRKSSGLANIFDRKSKIIKGTRSYIAPETIRKKTPSPQTDLYSLGVTLFEILTGKPPFMGATPQDLLRQHIGAVPVPPSELNPNVTPEMDRLVRRLLAKNPKDRPGSAQELYGEFRNISPFKEDLQDETQEADEDEEDLLSQTDQVRLDSRFDHKRSELLKNKPELAKSLAAAKKAKSETIPPAETKPSPQPEPNPAQQQPAPPQPATQQPMPQMPMQPAAMMPQQPAQPVVPDPPQPMVAQQGTLAMPTQPPMPQIPQPQSVTTQQPPAVQPVQQVVGQPQQPVPAPPTSAAPNPTPAMPTNALPAEASNPATPASNSLPESDDDLPLMDELPDVM